MECKAEEAALAAADHAAADVQERRAGRVAIDDRPDVAGLLDHEPAPGAVAGIRQQDGVIEAGRDGPQRDVDLRRVERHAAGRHRTEPQEEDQDETERREPTNQRQLSGSRTKNQSCVQRSLTPSQRCSMTCWPGGDVSRMPRSSAGMAAPRRSRGVPDHPPPGATTRGRLPWIREEATYAAIGISLRRATIVGNPYPRAILRR